MSTSTEELQQHLSAIPALQSSAQYKLYNQLGEDVLEVPKESVIPVLQFLKNTGRFDFLMDVCGVDYPERAKRFDVVYHLFNSSNARRLRIKTQVGENE